MKTSELYLEERIKKVLYEMSSTFSELHHRHDMHEFSGGHDYTDEEEEIISMIKSDFVLNANSVYKLICNFIENAGQYEYLKQFKEAIFPLYENEKTILAGKLDDNSGELYNVLLNQIWDFLNAYQAFGETNMDYLLKRTGIHFLENILENTAVIINELNLTPTSEAEVYNSVKVVTKGVFPASQHPTSIFMTHAQEYKPDILIPYLNCAIEYKYATTEARLKSTIDQIFADVSGYSNHDVYKIFYAVFYVKPDIWGGNKFEEVWTQKGFPKNWKGIYIVG